MSRWRQDSLHPYGSVTKAVIPRGVFILQRTTLDPHYKEDVWFSLWCHSWIWLKHCHFTVTLTNHINQWCIRYSDRSNRSVVTPPVIQKNVSNWAERVMGAQKNPTYSIKLQLYVEMNYLITLNDIFLKLYGTLTLEYESENPWDDALKQWLWKPSTEKIKTKLSWDVSGCFFPILSVSISCLFHRLAESDLPHKSGSLSE